MAKDTRTRAAVERDRAPTGRVARRVDERCRDPVAFDPECDESLPGRGQCKRGRAGRRERCRDECRARRHVASEIPCLSSGSERIRFPDAAKIALQSAGITGALAGSPTPPQKPPVGASTTSTLGISAALSIR